MDAPILGRCTGLVVAWPVDLARAVGLNEQACDGGRQFACHYAAALRVKLAEQVGAVLRTRLYSALADETPSRSNRLLSTFTRFWVLFLSGKHWVKPASGATPFGCRARSLRRKLTSNTLASRRPVLSPSEPATCRALAARLRCGSCPASWCWSLGRR